MSKLKINPLVPPSASFNLEEFQQGQPHGLPLFRRAKGYSCQNFIMVGDWT
jgi:hypothetical protein